ncbi:MAG: hypothetical protein U0575_02440 [Phycisphaerales bacterium]
MLVSDAASADVVDLPRFPAVSPDGQEIVFSWRGDLWKLFATGGPAVRLTSHPQDDLAAAWSPDGRLIAFESDRDGFRNIFLMAPDGGDLRQLTELDRAASLAGFGVDEAGKPVVTFTATLEPDLYRSPRPYMISLDGGQPRRVHDAFGSSAMVSPDGRRVLFERGGSAWSRRHYRGPDNRDVWLFDRRDRSFRALTTWDGNDGHARWAGDDTILFLSDREPTGDGKVVNLWRMSASRGDASATKLTDFADDVVDFDVSADGRTVVAAVWDSLYRIDLSAAGPTGVPTPRKLEIQAPADQRDAIELRDVGKSASEAILSPDGKTLAVVAYGDVYVRAAEEKSPTRAVTRSEAREKQIAWSPDGATLYFVTDESGQDEIRAATVAATRSELRTKAKAAAQSETASAPAPSPASTPPSAAAEPPASVEPAASTAAKDEPKPTTAAEPRHESATPAGDPKRWVDAVRFDVRSVVAAPEGARIHRRRSTAGSSRIAAATARWSCATSRRARSARSSTRGTRSWRGRGAPTAGTSPTAHSTATSTATSTWHRPMDRLRP